MNQIIPNPKQEEILKTAHQLFWKYGIRKVTIEEICKEAGTSKMTFYRFFPNKIELAKNVLTNIFDDSIAKYREIMAENIPFHEKIKKQILLKFEGTKEISPELIKDIYGGQIGELKQHWENKSNEVLLEVLESYRIAQNKGWIREGVNVEFIQFYSAKLFELVSDKKAVALYENVQGLIMEIMNLFFYGIIPPEEKK